jgi:phosphomannomutase
VAGLPVDQILRELEAGFPGAVADRTDGLKLLVDGGWVHVRRSNTEPILRLMAEAKDEESVDGLLRRTRELVERVAAGSSG